MSDPENFPEAIRLREIYAAKKHIKIELDIYFITDEEFDNEIEHYLLEDYYEET